jgi:hypothetical protein
LLQLGWGLKGGEKEVVVEGDVRHRGKERHASCVRWRRRTAERASPLEEARARRWAWAGLGFSEKEKKKPRREREV